MGLVYHKKQDEQGDQDNRAINWYDYYRDKVLNLQRTEVETQIDLPKGNRLIISEELPSNPAE